MSKEAEQIYIPRFEDAGPYYNFSSKHVHNTQVANRITGGTKYNGEIVRVKDLYHNELWVDFGKLDGNQIIAIDDAFITHKHDDNFVRVWDKPAVRQADWWGLNGGRTPDLIEFTSKLTLWNTVPKAPSEEKTPVAAKTFEMIQNVLQEEEKYTANRFFNLDGFNGILKFKTGVVFKTRPNVFDLLAMNGRYDFIMWFFINGDLEGMTMGKGLKWLEAYLKDVKQNRNKYLESQYAKQL